MLQTRVLGLITNTRVVTYPICVRGFSSRGFVVHVNSLSDALLTSQRKSCSVSDKSFAIGTISEVSLFSQI